MSAETGSSTETIELYIPLLNEGIDACRPTTGILLGPDTVQVLATEDYDPTIEEWEFPPGSKVRFVTEVRSDGLGSREVLVARQRLA